MPAMVIIGLAKTKPILYAGLTLFSFGKLTSGLLFRLETKECGGRVGLVVRALAFHQCGPGSISLGGIRGLSLLVLYSAMRGFPPGTPVFPSHQKPTFDLIYL